MNTHCKVRKVEYAINCTEETEWKIRKATNYSSLVNFNETISAVGEWQL